MLKKLKVISKIQQFFFKYTLHYIIQQKLRYMYAVINTNSYSYQHFIHNNKVKNISNVY